MKTAIKATTPTDAGLSLAVLSGPRGSVREDWPSIQYTVELSDARKRVIYTGEYNLGIGHVKAKPYAPFMSQEDKSISDKLGSAGKWLVPLIKVADVAASLARVQKVAPKLDDVCRSILSEGSAFFDGQRFEDWAGDFGYSADSIKAKETFEACDKIGRDLSRALSRDELAGLREWAGNY